MNPIVRCCTPLVSSAEWFNKRLSVTRLSVALLCLMTIMGHHAAYADPELPMHLQVGKLTVTDKGVNKFVLVNSADIGEVIQYRATYSNPLDTPINDVFVTLPIPYQMTFTGEAYPMSAQGSTDGINYSDTPLLRHENGKLVAVPFSEYKSLRWHIKLLPAHKTATVSLNATIENSPQLLALSD